MYHKTFSFSLIVILGLFTSLPCLHSQDLKNKEKLEQLLNDYIVGWRNGDKELLSNIFALEQGSVVWISGKNEQEQLNSMSFEEIIKRQKPRLEYGLDWKILTLDIVDNKLAFAKLSISRSGGSYIDFLICQKIAGEWRIVNKSFVVR